MARLRFSCGGSFAPVRLSPLISRGEAAAFAAAIPAGAYQARTSTMLTVYVSMFDW